MAPCYGKNGILKGTVDFYCLVCETYLRSEADNIDHIAKPIHKKNLDSTQYVKDFEEDFVRKIKKRYFCELCNKLLPMMARVKIHVNEPSHIDRKNITFFKRTGVNIVAFGKVVINDKAWNGLNDESCAFCNTEYENEEIHKNLLSHILNIIQIKVEVDENKNIYRKIDDVSFHCLTCNMVLALNNMTRHFEEDHHKHLYQECCAISTNKINENELKEKECDKVIEDRSHRTSDRLAMPLNNTEEISQQARMKIVSDINTKCDILEEIKAIDALYEIDGNGKESKIAINSIVPKEVNDSKENSQDSVIKPLNKLAENKEESKNVKDMDVNKQNKNLEDKIGKKNKTKINPLNNTNKSGTSNEIHKTSRSKSGFNIEKYEKKICKILKAEDYITLDENGKTLCILCDWIMDPKCKKIHTTGLHHQTMEKMHKKRLREMGERNNIQNTVKDRSISDLVNEFQANNININLIFNTAVCRKCTVNIPYDVNAIKDHILKHNNETYNNKNEVILPSCEAIEKETSEVTIKNKVILPSCEAIDKEPSESTNEVTIKNKVILPSCEAIEKETNESTSEVTIKNKVILPSCEAIDKEPSESTSEVTIKNKVILPSCEAIEEETSESTSEVTIINKVILPSCEAIEEETSESTSEVTIKNKVILPSCEAIEKETSENTSEVTIKENSNEGDAVIHQNEEKLVSVEDRKENEPTNKQPVVNNEYSLKDEAQNRPGEVHIQKQSLASYIKILIGIKHMIFNDIIINEIFCVSVTSFNYLLSTKGEIKCLVCEEEVCDIEAHINKFKHIKLMNETPIITNEKSEFVREIHSELLHCGFCNMTVLSWCEMQEHFNSSSHKEIKNAAGWRMRMYSTEFEGENHNRMFNEASELSIRNMFSGLF